MIDLIAANWRNILFLLLLVTAGGLISVATSGASQQRWEVETSAITQGMLTHFTSADGRYGTACLTDAQALVLGIAPQTLRLDDTTLRNEWNGGVDVCGNGGTYFIDYDNVPREQCTRMVTSMTPGTRGVSVRVAATLGAAQAAAATPVRVTAATAATLCAAPLNAVRREFN